MSDQETVSILVVEDSKTQSDWLRLTLNESGMQTVCVDSLSACIPLLKREQFSAVLLDLTLPDSLGLETLSAVTSLVPSVPVVVLTAVEDQALGLEALQHGADEFLVKGETSPSAVIRAVRYSIERKKQMRALRQMHRSTREIIERARDAFVAVDADGLIIDWNRKAQTLFGFSRLQAIGEPLAELILDDSCKSNFVEGLKEYKDRGSGFLVTNRVELVAKNKYGAALPCEFAFFPVQTDDTYCLYSFVADLTVRKEVEQRMNEFYSVVSHELRSPVTSIRGGLRLLEGGIVGELTPKMREVVTVSISSCDRLIRLISDLLDISKIEAGAMELKLRDIQPAELIDGAIDGIQGMAAEAKVELTKEVNVRKSLRADGDKMLQVLTNLVSNAIKFSPENTSIRLKAESGASGTVRFSVTDQGPGIPAKDLHKVFGKFQQLENSVSLKTKGTGLGLAISKAIVSQHSGEIGVESVEGEGTTFWFEVPSDN